ncbi:MAG: cytochrome P450 [Steroidobacteraceae bacterium]
MNVDFFCREIARDPYPILEEIRAQGPIVWNDLMKTWMVTSDALCRKIMLAFSKFTHEGTIGEQLFGMDAIICMTDKERHDRLRAVWSVAFQPSTLERNLSSMIRQCAAGLLAPVEERLRAGEVVEVFRKFCRDIPAYVIAEMLGMPANMRKSLVEWSDAMAEEASAAGDPLAPQFIASENAKAAFAQYLQEQIRERRRNPGPDLISQIVQSDIGKTLSTVELMQNCRQLLFAGNETTARWLSNSIVVLGKCPDVRRYVVENPSRLPAVLEEIMRWDPNVQADPRMTSGETVEMGGVELRDGQHLYLLFGAANRDPARHENPAVFDVHRQQKGHLGFGFGMHNCLGQSLARLEAAITIGLFLERIPDYEFAGEIDYGASFLVRGPQTVPLALR